MNNNIIHEVNGIKAPDLSNVKSAEEWLKITSHTIQLIIDKNEKEKRAMEEQKKSNKINNSKN